METCKYYLGRNTKDGGGVWYVEIFRVSENIEEISYIRIPGGDFNISRKTYVGNDNFIDNGYEEIDEIEYETIYNGIIEGSLTIERFMSYFEERCPITVFPKYSEFLWISEEIGFPIIDIKSYEIPRPLQESVPWISGNYLIGTKDCVKYLEAQKKRIIEGGRFEKEGKENLTWILNGVDKLLKIIENYEEK